MSIKLMTAVFDRYPNGGGEMLLALALADHASDDGTKVFPKIKALSQKTRQSERSVQYQLRRMEETGWLIRVSAGNGGRSMSTEYSISPDWIAGGDLQPLEKGTNENGAEIAPFLKGAIHDRKGCNPRQKRVQPIAPANNRQEPSMNRQGESALKPATLPAARAAEPEEVAVKPRRAASLPRPDDVTEQTWSDWLQLRKAKRAVVTATVLDGARSEANKAGLTLEAFLQVWCVRGSQGLIAEWLKPSERQAGGRPGAAPNHKFAAAAATIYEA